MANRESKAGRKEAKAMKRVVRKKTGGKIQGKVIKTSAFKNYRKSGRRTGLF